MRILIESFRWTQQLLAWSSQNLLNIWRNDLWHLKLTSVICQITFSKNYRHVGNWTRCRFQMSFSLGDVQMFPVNGENAEHAGKQPSEFCLLKVNAEKNCNIHMTTWICWFMVKLKKLLILGGGNIIYFRLSSFNILLLKGNPGRCGAIFQC